MTKSSIIIVDDHRLFRKGLRALIEDLNNYTVIAEASNGQEFLDLLSEHKPDIVLMDISMPVMNGIEATKKALSIYPELKILVLSMYGDEEYYYMMIDAGVKGFLLKDSAPEELESAMQLLIHGENYFSSDLLTNIIRNFNSNKQEMSKIQKEIKLSSRELEVLENLCKGLSTNEIADKLFLSNRTVERHRANLLLKTGTKNAVSLVMYAIKSKLINVHSENDVS